MKNINAMKNINSFIKSHCGFGGISSVSRRYLVLLTALLSLGVGQAWADYSITNAQIYYDDSNSNYSSDVVIAFDKSGGFGIFAMGHIDHTKLHHWSGSWGDGGVTYMRFGKTTHTYNWYGVHDAIQSTWDIATCNDNSKNWTYVSNGWGLSIENASKMFGAASNSQGANLTKTDLSGYSALNHSQTVYKYTSTDNGSSYSAASINSGTVTISAYKMTGNGTASNTSNSATINTAATTSASKDAAYTGEVTLTASANTGYTFVGWFDVASGGSALSTSAEYTYNAPNSTKSIYARFQRDTYTITYNNMTGATNHASNPSNYNVASGAITLQTPTKTGYIFEGWYSDSEFKTSATTIAAGSTGYKVFYAKWTAITVSDVSFSPSSSGTTDSHTFTMTFTTNVPTDNTYQYQIREFVSSGSSYGSGNQIGATFINAATITTSSMTPSQFNSVGTYKTQIQILKSGSVVYSSIDYTYTIANASDPTWTMKNDATTLGTFTNNGDNTYTLQVTVPSGGYSLTHYDNDKSFSSAPGAETLTSERTLVNNNGRIAWQDGMGIFRIRIRKDGENWKILATKLPTVITLDGNGGTNGDETISNAFYGSVLPSFTKHTQSGYTLTGYWTETSGGTKIIDANGTLVNSVSDYTNGSGQLIYDGTALTLHAQWTEKMSTLTTSNSYDAGNPGYAAPTKSVSSIGISTTATITAATPGTGYSFAGWTLTNCTRTDGGAANATSITIRSNGDEAAATVVANYAEDVSTTWYINGDADNGDNNSPFSGWGTNGTPMTKKSGYSTVEKYYCTITVNHTATGSGWGFKAYNSSGADDAHRYYAYSDKSYTKEANTSTIYTNNNAENMHFLPYLTGDYEFELDNTGTNPILTIHWPVINQVRISAANPADVTNVGNFNLSDPVSNVRTKTLTLNANTTYTFKIVYDSEWYGNGGALTRSASTSSNTLTDLSTSGGDMTLTTDYAGSYTFKFNQSTKTLSVDFPEAYQVSLEVGTVKGNKNTPKIYHGEVASNITVSNGTWIPAGDKVNFWIANSSDAAKAGYDWWGFYNNPTGEVPQKYTHSDVGMYTIPSLSANATVYAVFAETNYWISTSSENGSITPVGGQNAHIETPSEDFTATPSTGYKFDGWTIPANVTAASTYTSSSNPIRVNATAAATLQANFSPRYAVKVKAAGGSWSANDANLLTGYGEGQIGYVDIPLNANTDYEIQVFDRQTSKWYGGSATQNIYYAYSNTEYTIATTSSSQSVFIKTGAAGTYRFAWNLTGYKIAVTYPTSRFIEIGQNIAEAGSVTAVDGESNTIVNGQAIRDGGSITFTAATNTGYNLSGWFDNEGCTTGQYTTGTNVTINSEAKTLTLNNVDNAKTVYAKFAPKTYPITLTQTGAKITGTASATATYNTVLPAITKPTPADGYAFMGYFTAADGAGTKFIDENGAWIANITGYTDAEKKWIQDGVIELFAYFKKAEISISLSSKTVEKNTTVTATATLDPQPAGTMAICWELQYNNTNLYCNDCFTPASGNSVSFEAPGISGTFIVKATLRNATCDGEEIDNTTTDLTVAGNHTVTIRYMGDGSQLQASTEMTAAPLVWSNEITAPSIFGYTFAGWTAGDGITITDDNGTTSGTSSSCATIKLQATYEGTLTANYVETPTVYFYNNLGWSDVYVTYDAYWDDGENQGTGNNSKTYHHMTRIEGTNIWYDVIPTTYTSSGFRSWAHNIAFNDSKLGNIGTGNYKYFNKGNVIFRRDFDPYNTMFVPATTDVAATYTKNDATYCSSNLDYNDGKYYYRGGYWKKYNSTYSGYSLRGTFAGVIGNETDWSGEEHNLYSEIAEETAEGWVTTTSLPLNGNRNYDFRIYRNHLKNDCSSAYTNNGTMTISNHTGWRFETTKDWRSNNCTLQAATPGVYTFKVVFDKNGRIYVSVDYPMYAGDYRLLYKDDEHMLWHPSEAIHPGNEQDIVSFFSRTTDKNPVIKWQYSTDINNTGTITWSTPADISLTDWVGADKAISENGVYNFILNYDANTHALTLADVKPYTGNYYIRTNCTGKNKWENYKNDPDHTMTYSEYSFTQETHPYSHYYTHWVDKDKDAGAYKNVKFVIANDYSPCISDTMTREDATGEWANIANYIDESGNLKRNANVRFMWNQSTNEISRAYIDGAQGTGSNIFLRLLSDDSKVYDLDNAVQASTAFTDNQNWIYEANVKANPNAQIRLLSTWGESNTIEQYFKGTSAGGTETLIGGAGDTKFRIRLLYDFKTNRLVAAWLPDGEITTTQEIDADIMIIREHQGAGQAITFSAGKQLTKVNTVYGAMKFNRWTLNNKSTATGHAVLPVGQQKSIYERSLYFISFPFDVKVSEIFGFGHYWDEWYLEYYDGLNRAKNGYWNDSGPNWKYVTPEMAKTFELKANEGYILGLDLDYMADDNTTFWAHGIESVELFFPSTVDMGTLESTSFTMPALGKEYECKINRGTATGDRRVKDSYWRCIGVPGFSNYNSVLTKGEGGANIVWQTYTEWRADFKDYPFLYSWNMQDNSLTAQSTSNFNFQCMHAYLVQNGNEIHWSAVSTKPSSIVARRARKEADNEHEWRIELKQDTTFLDQTYVRMSNMEQVTDSFDFGQDMIKELNSRSNIYTYIGYEKVAANSMTVHSDQTTVIPVGANIRADGEYTFAMPDGTSGVGVTLIDNVENTRTNLSALDYTVTLSEGEYTNRFFLEISPVQNTPTDIEAVSGQPSEVRKVMIDGILYIVRDGKMYDARGTLVHGSAR